MSEACGAFSYSLFDADTDQLLDPAVFFLDETSSPQPFVRIVFPSRSPFLTNSPLRIEVKTDVEFSSQSATSAPLVITVQDPCF